MEKQVKTISANVRPSYRRLFIAALLTAGIFSFAQAQEAPKPAAEIRYAGAMNDKLLFGVEYNNSSAEPFSVEVKDGDGYVFFTGRFKDKKFRKYFAIDKSELDKTSITIQVADKSGVQKQVFDINTSSKVVEEVSVVRL